MRVTHSQLSRIIEAQFAADNAMWVWGTHGIGKSSVFKAFAKKHGHYFMCFYMSTMGDPSELAGIAIPTKDEEGKDVVRYVLLDQLQKAINWAKANPDKYVIVVFDEVNRVERSDIQGALFSFVLDKRAGQTELPSNFRCVALANPPTDDYLVSRSRDIALDDRFAHNLLEPNPKEFIKYGQENQVDHSIISFLAKNEEATNNGAKTWDEYETVVAASPRKWNSNCDRLVKYCRTQPDFVELLNLCLPSLIGETLTTTFISHIEAEENGPVSGDDIINNFSEERVQKRWAEINDFESGREDLIFTTINSLGITAKAIKKLSDEQKKNVQNFALTLRNEIFQKIITEETRTDSPLFPIVMAILANPKIVETKIAQTRAGKV
jgi:hypothetical protein